MTLFHGPKPEKSPVTYTVTFNANGASGTPPETQIVNDGATIILPDKGGMNSTGNIFVGWNESSSGGDTTNSVGASVTVTRNMVFYAQWLDGSTPQYTVSFNANGATSGASPASQTVYRGISITIPGQGTLAYSGKTFGGWNTQANGGGTLYAVGATFTVTGDVTLYAKWNEIVLNNYKLGDTGPGGGKIFYYSANGFTMTDTGEICHYFEAAPDNISSTKVAWTSQGNISSVDTALVIGSGRNNTAIILAADVFAPAVKACYEYSNNGKTDWFLPSKDELNRLYINRAYVGNLGTLNYWSSSQSNSSGAYYSMFRDGYQGSFGKYAENGYVRAIRAF